MKEWITREEGRGRERERKKLSAAEVGRKRGFLNPKGYNPGSDIHKRQPDAVAGFSFTVANLK